MNTTKLWKTAISWAMLFALLLSFWGCTPEETPSTSTPENIGSDTNAGGTSIDLNVTTFTYSDATFLESIANQKAYGTDSNCTGMQGLAASEKYLYVTKQTGNKYAVVVQYDIENDTQRTLEYYSSPTSIKQTALNCVGHSNDMVVYSEGDTQYLLISSTYNPASTTCSIHCLANFLLDEEKGTIHLTGVFNLLKTGEDGTLEYLSAGGLCHVAQTEEYNYYLIKDAFEFYWCKIPVGAKGGTMSDPTNIMCTHLFSIAHRNALFVGTTGSANTIDNLEAWTNQGAQYSPYDNLLYVPFFNSCTGGFAGFDNVIVTFDMTDIVSPEALDAVTTDQEMTVHPTNLSFRFLYSGQDLFEVENCAFLLNQGEDGDLSMYFNTNGSTVSEFEGIWKVDYTSGSVETESLVNDDSIVYTIDYNYNAPMLSPDEWPMDLPSWHYDMTISTHHIAGIESNLRINTFTKKGFAFLGWNLHRQSDDTWLCTDGNWYAKDAIPEGVSIKTLKDTTAVDNLTEVNGDVITAYASWY